MRPGLRPSGAFATTAGRLPLPRLGATRQPQAKGRPARRLASARYLAAVPGACALSRKDGSPHL